MPVGYYEKASTTVSPLTPWTSISVTMTPMTPSTVPLVASSLMVASAFWVVANLDQFGSVRIPIHDVIGGEVLPVCGEQTSEGGDAALVHPPVAGTILGEPDQCRPSNCLQPRDCRVLKLVVSFGFCLVDDLSFFQYIITSLSQTFLAN